MPISRRHRHHIARHNDGPIGVDGRAVAQLAIVVPPHCPERPVRVHEQRMPIPRCSRHHIARHNDRPVGAAGCAVAQLAILVVAPSQQGRISHRHQRRQADDHSARTARIGHHHIIRAGIGHACVRHHQCAVRRAQNQTAVLEPLIRLSRVACHRGQRQCSTQCHHLVGWSHWHDEHGIRGAAGKVWGDDRADDGITAHVRRRVGRTIIGQVHGQTRRRSDFRGTDGTARVSLIQIAQRHGSIGIDDQRACGATVINWIANGADDGVVTHVRRRGWRTIVGEVHCQARRRGAHRNADGATCVKLVQVAQCHVGIIIDTHRKGVRSFICRKNIGYGEVRHTDRQVGVIPSAIAQLTSEVGPH